uniref:MARVEL domain-containing protein n=1 Tax=Plectus sambesii TaxID=2011161 RepID=A0A914WMR4_9BILA
MTEAVQLRVDFLRTPHGIIKLIQIVLGFIDCMLIGWYCVSILGNTYCYSVSNLYGDTYGWQGLVITVLAITLIINFMQLLLHFLNLNNVWSNVNWCKVEMIYALVGFILFMICMILETYYSIHYNVYVRWLIGAIFGWIICASYAAEAYLFQSGRIQ